MAKVAIKEVFTSLDGEVSQTHQGRISTFIRLGHCNLQCDWCDAEGHNRDFVGHLYDDNFKDAYNSITKWNGKPIAKKITITGGEPLLPGNADFITMLVKGLVVKGHAITIETNGTVPLLPEIRHNIRGYVVDLKLFLQDEGKTAMMMKALPQMNSSDILKILISQPHHIGLAKQFLDYYTVFKPDGDRAVVAISIVNDGLDYVVKPVEVIEDFINSGYDVVFNFQLHKYLLVP